MPAHATERVDNRMFLGASLQSRDGTVTKDALVTNGFVEQKKNDSTVFKRGGLNLITTIGSGGGQGITNFIDSNGIEILYAAQNGSLSISNVPSASGVWTTRTGTLSNSAGFTSFGGYIWAVVGTTAYYKASVTDTSWLTAATSIFSSIDSGTREQGTLIAFSGAMYLIGPSVNGSGIGSKEVWKSFDGATWTRITSTAAFSAQIFARVIVYNNAMWLLSGYVTGNNNVWTSTDGITWTLVVATPAYGSTARTGFAAVTAGSVMMVVGGTVSAAQKNDVWTSTDGVTWTQLTAAGAFTAVTIPTVMYTGGILYLLGGNNGSPVDQIYSSPTGLTWTTVSHSGIDLSNTWSGSGSVGLFHKGRIELLAVTGAAESIAPVGAGGNVSVGTLTPSSMVDFSKNLDGSQIMIRSDFSAFKLVPATNALSIVSDAQYPGQTVRGNPYLDGTFYVMTPAGVVYGSDDEDCSSWTTANKITAEFEPDSGVCLAKYNNYIVAFGQWTTQMFWDAAVAAPASPLAPVQNGVILIGCAHANSVSQVEATILWMAQRKGQGSSFQKGRFIAMLEGQSYVRVSTPDVDRILDADDLATVYSCVGSFAGHNFYILSLGTTGVSLVYDMTQKLWYVWTQCTAGSGKTVTALTQSNGLATATSTAHGFSDGDPVTIAGAGQSGYNLTFVNVNVVDANTFTYPVAAATVSPATGSITATSVTESYFSVCASCNYGGQQVFQAVSGGAIYSLLDSVFQDNSQPTNFKVRTSNQDEDTNERKFCTEVTPLCDLTTSTQTALLRCTDNDYQTYTAYRRFDISDASPRSQRWGNYRRRAWEWRYTGNTRHRIGSLEIDQFREGE